MARKKEYIRWAITGECGLYVGQRLTMRDAIAEHISDIHGVSPYVGNGLDSNQRAAWDLCRQKGDRAVKVRIILDRTG
jgi:hypothetical protein